MSKYSVGVDISKKDFHVCLSVIDSFQQVKVLRSGTFANSKSGFAALVTWLKASRKDKSFGMAITMEATGVYFENCALFLYSKGYAVSVVLPNKAKKYIGSLGIRTKNDKSDAKALSRMGAEQVLDKWAPHGPFFYELRALTRHSQSLKEMRTSATNQLEAIELGMYPSKSVIRSQKKMIAIVDEQIVSNTKAISAHIASNEEVSRKILDITAIKGVAELTAATVLAETNGFELFNSIGQLVSYAGYDVVENQSGTHNGKTKISKQGNSRIRRALHMSSLCVVTHEVDIFKDLFERTYEKHKIKMKSYVAIQKKLLGIMYTLWKKNEKFDPKYGIKDTAKDEEVVHSSRGCLEEAV